MPPAPLTADHLDALTREQQAAVAVLSNLLGTTEEVAKGVAQIIQMLSAPGGGDVADALRGVERALLTMNGTMERLPGAVAQAVAQVVEEKRG